MSGLLTLPTQETISNLLNQDGHTEPQNKLIDYFIYLILDCLKEDKEASLIKTVFLIDLRTNDPNLEIIEEDYLKIITQLNEITKFHLIEQAEQNKDIEFNKVWVDTKSLYKGLKKDPSSIEKYRTKRFNLIKELCPKVFEYYSSLIN